MAGAQSPEFKQAAEDVQNLNTKPSDEDMLELYGLYKQGTHADFSKATKPGAFSFREKYKYNAWEKVKDMSPEEAQTAYVKKVDELKAKHGF